MFTGIIQAIGKVVKYDGNQTSNRRKASRARRLGRVWIEARFSRVMLGESIAVEGVCLTVAAHLKRRLAFDIGRETQRVTTLKRLPLGTFVNLERALRVGDRLGGHWVSGHVEQTGTIVTIQKEKRNWWYTFKVPKTVLKYVVVKGSIAIDGISLTVASVRTDRARIMVIPHTLSHTTLSRKNVGDHVNMEPDLLAKYALQRRSGQS